MIKSTLYVSRMFLKGREASFRSKTEIKLCGVILYVIHGLVGNDMFFSFFFFFFEHLKKCLLIYFVRGRENPMQALCGDHRAPGMIYSHVRTRLTPEEGWRSKGGLRVVGV